MKYLSLLLLISCANIQPRVSHSYDRDYYVRKTFYCPDGYEMALTESDRYKCIIRQPLDSLSEAQKPTFKQKKTKGRYSPTRECQLTFKKANKCMEDK